MRNTHRLDFIQRTCLHELMREDYPASGLDDGKYAVRATAKLGFLVTRGHVLGLRRQFGLPPNRPRVVRTATTAEHDTLADLRQRVARLEALLANRDALIKHFNGRD